MNVTKNKIKKCCSIGEDVFVITAQGYMPAKIIAFYDDCVETDVDVLFYDEIGSMWCLCEKTAQNITRQSQKNVI